MGGSSMKLPPVNASDSGGWVTPEEYAGLIGRSVRTVRRMCETGELTTERLGRMWRIDPHSTGVLARPNDRRRPPDDRSISPVSARGRDYPADSVDTAITTQELERIAAAAETERLRQRVAALESENTQLQAAVGRLTADLIRQEKETASAYRTVAGIANDRAILLERATDP
jgi:excisionase family DNA binding protein